MTLFSSLLNSLMMASLLWTSVVSGIIAVRGQPLKPESKFTFFFSYVTFLWLAIKVHFLIIP